MTRQALEQQSANFVNAVPSQCRPSLRDAESERLRAVIEQSVALVFGIDTLDITRPTRGRANIALARQVAMYTCHVSCGRTLTDVGRIFSRDRTTVAHACSLIEDRRDDPLFDYVVELLDRIVRSLVEPRAFRPN